MRKSRSSHTLDAHCVTCPTPRGSSQDEGAAPRRTFVVRVQSPGGPAQVQDIRTGERAQVAELAAIAGVIDRWLRRDDPEAGGSGVPAAVGRLGSLLESAVPVVAGAPLAAADSLRANRPELVFTTLGSFGVRRASHEIATTAWERPMAARVVRFLLVRRGERIREDDLFDRFWPDADPASARNRLRAAVSRARAVLDLTGSTASVIESTERSYRLALGDRDTVDADEFEASAHVALESEGNGRLALLARAAALWGGEPLPEERYETWAALWRERLLDRYAEVLAALAEESDRVGNHAQSVHSARALVELDPTNEGFQRRLIRAFARSGRRGHALRQFLECRRVLIEELGVEPEKETADLHSRILAGDSV
jgi:DNA-binding SARP family transcriptional activator